MGLLTSSWFSDVPWLHVYVGFSLTIEAFEQFLNLRQLLRYRRSKQPPAALNSVVSPAQYAAANAYNTDRMQLNICSSLVHAGASLLSTVFFFSPYCWRLAGSFNSKNEYLRPLIFVSLQRVLSECISIPFELYSDFVVEQQHGFNKKTPFLFVKDKLLGLFVSAVIGFPLLSAVTWLIKWGGSSFHFWLWGFSVATTFLMIVLYPNLIAPLFNKFEVLKDQELRQKIDQLAADMKFPLREVYEMDGSRRSAHSNAYFYGLWRWKRIVLFDTLLHLPHDQVLAVLGHELGHWQKSHMTQRLSIAFLNLFVVFYLFSKVLDNDHLYECFGFGSDEKAPIVGLMLFANILAPVNTVMGLLSTLLSRAQEFQADAFACELGFGKKLKEALLKIHTDNKSSLDPDPWRVPSSCSSCSSCYSSSFLLACFSFPSSSFFLSPHVVGLLLVVCVFDFLNFLLPALQLFSWWHYSHPPLLERLHAIDVILKKTDKEDEKAPTDEQNNKQQQQQKEEEENEEKGAEGDPTSAAAAAGPEAARHRKGRQTQQS
ncbi:hypothetical protein Efla_001598 [Eimeria flavescens]